MTDVTDNHHPPKKKKKKKGKRVGSKILEQETSTIEDEKD